MRNTKIVCTLGPSTDKDGVLRALIENGMNVARFNFSHGDYDEHRRRFEALRSLSKELDRPVAAMLDTKGPEIRLGTFKNGSENLVAGQKFTLTSREIEGTNEISSITYKELPRDVQPGGRIMLDDGLISLRIENVTDTDIHCIVENDGVIKTKKGVNVPGVHLSMPYMSNRDRSDILFGVEQGFDLISASFTRCAQDILEIRHLVNENGGNIRIIHVQSFFRGNHTEPTLSHFCISVPGGYFPGNTVHAFQHSLMRGIFLFLHQETARQILRFHTAGIFFSRYPHLAVTNFRTVLGHQILPQRYVSFRFQFIRNLQHLRFRIIGKTPNELFDPAVAVSVRKMNLTASSSVR